MTSSTSWEGSSGPGNIQVKFRNEEGEIEFTPAAIHVGEKVHLDHTIFAADFRFLQGLVDQDVTAKLTSPSPSMVHYRGGRAAIDPSVYPDVEDFWRDLTAAYREQVQAVADLGCRYLQFDDTSLAYLNDPRQREQLASLGEDAEHLHETYIRHLNEVLADRPQGLTGTTHMCRGNFRSSWVAEGGYYFVAEAFARGEAATQLNDRALLQAMLDVEVALLRALAQAGMAPPRHPKRVTWFWPKPRSPRW